jgi:hypothetical protein
MRSATWTAMPNNVRKLNNTAVAKSVWYSNEKKLAGLLVSSILGCGFLGATYLDFKSNTNEMLKDARSILSPSDIQHSSTTSVKLRDLESKKLYIHRPDLESKIDYILRKENATDKYYVVYGPKGVGKSVLIDKCVDGMEGVVKVIISSVFQKSDILKVLSTKLLGAGSPAVNEEEMVDALYNAKLNGRLPTLIFEIERGQGAEQTACINNVRSLCKQFAVCSNCIIILSETNAVLVFGQDKDREEIILVPELTQGEALEFIRARRKGVDVNEKELMRLFDNVGTNAATLESFLNGDMSVDEFITVRIKAARHALVAFPLKPILKALKEHPEGVPPEYFNNEEYKGVDLSNPVEVGAVMKAAQSNVVYYDMEKDIYKLNSHALEVALRSYEPIIKK